MRQWNGGKKVNVYRKAIEVIKERGRGIRYLCGPDKTVCLIGAMATVKGVADDILMGPTEIEGYDAVREEVIPVASIIRDNYPERTIATNDLATVWQFNDHHNTTDDDVILVLEKAAIQWDELNG